VQPELQLKVITNPKLRNEWKRKEKEKKNIRNENENKPSPTFTILI